MTPTPSPRQPLPNDDTVVGVIGLGYVGLPLAVAFGQHFRTTGFDIDAQRIADLKRGVDATREVGADELTAASRLRFTVEASDLEACDVLIVAVPTPIDEAKQPDLGAFRAASRTVGDVVRRGDVVVFRYPENPSTPFIKRVVGVPGDRIGYHDKVLYVNDMPAEQEVLGRYVGTGPGRSMTGASHRTERVGDCAHDILVQRGYPSREGDIVVPPGHYFVLGDNRDNSRDSRYWGTVPETHLIGKAFAIWLNASLDHGVSWSRIGTAIECMDEREPD